mmetsp:Transcript_2159/g.3790  ORF Transcript_2159/g.3790 Transcript_2159/m.3790 type:complete len:106 (+) Transcript_2159:36-353(+)
MEGFGSQEAASASFHKNMSQIVKLNDKKSKALSLLSRIDFSKAQKNKGKGDDSELEEIDPIMPRAGLVYSEKSNLTEVMCKPKILPLKSHTLQKLEQLEQDMQKQ